MSRLNNINMDVSQERGLQRGTHRKRRRLQRLSLVVVIVTGMLLRQATKTERPCSLAVSRPLLAIPKALLALPA